MPSSPPSVLHSHVYRAITGCNAQVRSWPPTSCRAEVDIGHIFLCLVFSAFYLSGLSRGTLTSLSQHELPTQTDGFHVSSRPASDRRPTGPERTSAENFSHLSVSPCHLPLYAFRQNTMQFISFSSYILRNNNDGIFSSLLNKSSPKYIST